MARRKQSSAEDIIELTSIFPWWVGALLAVISYGWLHNIAIKGMPQAKAGDLSAAMTGGLFYSFATIGQYVLPALFCFGAILSFLMGAKRRRLHAEVTTGERKVSDISWQEFELLIGEYFRRQGFTVQETDPGPDGGVDLVLKKNSAKYLVQCKHYKAYKVGVKPVRELLGVMASSGAAGGYVATSGEFTRDAIRFATSNNIELIDGKALDKILRSTPNPVQRVQPTPTPSKEQTTKKAQADPIAVQPHLSEEKSKICSKCGSPMVLRVAKSGKNVGQKFWGCSKFPACRGTLPF